MGDNIWGANREGSIQHPQAEHKPITWVARWIHPVAPDKLRRSIATMFRMWHDSTNKDCDDASSDG